jgi:hypothetical protein
MNIDGNAIAQLLLGVALTGVLTKACQVGETVTRHDVRLDMCEKRLDVIDAVAVSAVTERAEDSE